MKKKWEYPYSPKPMYCMNHESWGHFLCDDLSGEPCFWVTCPPPELPEHWEELVTEPSAQELEQMDLKAEDILLDVGTR